MGYKVQYNPSTGKVSYNPATGKVQVVGASPIRNCRSCTNTPSQIKVTFEGITTNNYQCQDVVNRDWEWEGLPDFNGEYILDQALDAECDWKTTMLLFEPSGFKRYYNSTDGSCSGGVYTSWEIVGLYIRVFDFNLDGSFTVNTDLLTSQSGSIHLAGAPWFRLGSLVFPTDCVNMEDEPSIYTSPTIQPGYGGTVTVEDI